MVYMRVAGKTNTKKEFCVNYQTFLERFMVFFADLSKTNLVKYKCGCHFHTKP